MAAQVLFDKEEKERKKTKKFAGDGCLNGLQQCGAMLSYADDSAFFFYFAGRLGRALMELQMLIADKIEREKT